MLYIGYVVVAVARRNVILSRYKLNKDVSDI